MEQIKHWLITNWKSTSFGTVVNVGLYLLVHFNILSSSDAVLIGTVLNGLGFAVASDPTKPIASPKQG